MNERTALLIKKVMSKKRIERIEKLIIEVGTTVQQMENGLVSMDVAQERISSLFKKAIMEKLIAPSNVPEIMSVDADTVEYLSKKHGVQ